MKFRSLELEGFQSYYERERVELDGLNLVAIIGPNASGKTSLLDAIEFALYGRARGDAVKSILARGADRAEVVLEFALGDSVFQITRTRTASDRHEAVVKVASSESESGWKELTEKTPASTDPFIVELLGMNSAAARATWIIGQNDFGAFCTLRPAPRRALLASTFGLDVFADLALKADAEKTKVSEQLDEAERELASLTARMEQLDAYDGPLVDKTDDELVALAKEADERAEKIAAALDKIVDSQSADDDLRSAQRALADYLETFQSKKDAYLQSKSHAASSLQTAQRALASAQEAHEKASAAVWDVDDHQSAHQSAVDAVAAVEESLSALRAQVSEQQQKVASLSAEQESIKTQGHEINEQLSTLETSVEKDEGHCFTCGQDLTRDEALALITEQKDLKQRLLDDFQSKGRESDAAQREIAVLSGTIKKQESALADARRTERNAEQVFTQTKALADSEPAAEKAVREAEDAVRKAQEALESIGDEPEPADPDRVSALEQNVVKAQEALDRSRTSAEERARLREERTTARETERAVWSEQERRASVAKERESLTEQVKEPEEKVATLTRDLNHYSALRAAFRPSGIPSLMLNGIVDELNAEANSILETLGGEIGVRVSTTREKQKGGHEEKVMVFAMTPTGEVDYSTLSGAEQFRLALALRCATSRCMARRTGVPMQTIILDEGWGALDEDVKRAVQDMLVRLSEEFSIFTVSHIDDVKDSFSTVIEVSKSSGTSRAVVTSR